MATGRDKLAGKASQIKGKVKQKVGRATGNRRLQAKGVVDRAKGTARELKGEILAAKARHR
jgi:uncharacterized protein YjbJ (UPF0337 family)